MNMTNKNYMSYTILILGLLSFGFYISSFEFTAASITMLSSILLWLAFSIYFDIFDKMTFSKILCFSGVLLSISIFLLFGIEEVPFPQGALLFHSDGIAITMFVLLLSVLPVLFLSENNVVDLMATSQSAEISKPKYEEDLDDDWEEATVEDLESGEFEVAA